jgi:putative hydrolase of the HAD superfamily
MPVKCITFDLDDTLWAINPVIARAEESFLEWMKEQLPEIAVHFTPQQLSDHRYQYFKQFPELHHDLSLLRMNWMTHLTESHGASPDKVEEGFNIFWKERNRLDLFDQVPEVLSHVNRIFRTGAVTNGNADLEQIGIDSYFDFYLTSAEVGFCKPHPVIWESVVSHANCEPREIIHVGDDPVRDVEGAANAGMKTVWVNTFAQKWEGALRPDEEITRISELPGALARLQEQDQESMEF